MDSPQDTIGADYQSTWDRFVMDLQRLQEHLAGAVAAGDTPSLHGVLQQLHWIPYKRVRPLLKQRLIDTPSTNVGCITGFFFEVFTSTLVAARIKMALPETRIECNQTTDPTTLDIARDPDIFVARGPNKCVFEIKVSPKK